MNPKQKRNAIVLGVLGLAFAFVLFRQFFGETAEQRQYRENMEKSEAQQAAGEAPAPDAVPAAAEPGAAPVTKSQFQKAAVDVDQLIKGVQVVAFDYDTDRMQTNPMTPLVGKSAHQALASAGGPGDAPGGATIAGDAQTVVRTFRVTGILWEKRDPMAVVSYPVKGELTSEVVTRGYTFPDTKIVVVDVEQDRVVLDASGTQVSLQLEER